MKRLCQTCNGTGWIDGNVKIDLHVAATALGRRGGRKGGKARAKKLSAERRREIAKRAAEIRWKETS